jgi:hypothetical protein
MEKGKEKITEILNDVKDAGFDSAIAIATNAEVKAGAACGQMSIINEKEKNTHTKGVGLN